MSALLNRLASQVGSKALAKNLLIKRGHMNRDGTLTKAGLARQALGNAGRAKDRAAKASGHKASQFKYNSSTNRATLR